jgi:translocation and assembly module TamA
MLVAAQSAYAFEIFGRKIFGSEEPENEDVIGEPQHYTVDFAVTGDTDATESILKGASGLWNDREKAASGAAGLMAKARSDYKRLLAALYAEGRYGGTISIQIAGREVADLQPDDALPEPAHVVVNVDTGPLFHFRAANIANEAPPPLEPRDVTPLPADEGFAPSQVARSGVVLKAEKLAVEAWRQQGFAKTRIIERRIEAAHDVDLVDADLTVEPGKRASYGQVSVMGTERMDAQFVAYMTGLGQGQEFDPDDLDRANKRLSRLAVFRALRIEEADEIAANGSLPIKVTVQERLPRRFGIGATYSTIDGAGFEGFWLHRNLFGKAEQLRFDAKIAGLGPTVDPAELTYRVGATFTKPGVFTPDTNFVASVYGDREVLDAYTRTAVTAEAGFTHLFNEEFSGRLFAVGGVARFDDDVYGRRDFATIGVLGGLTYDNRDNAADAVQGYYLDAQLEPFYEMEYGNLVGRFVGEARTYYGFGDDDRIVMAARLKVGSLVGAPIAELAPDKLFFAGGGGSVRGYGYRTIGASALNGEVVGGRSLIEGSAELRARVTETIGAVAFVDAAYVGAESFPDFNEDLKIGAGVGLRYLTGLGPIRLDLAMPLDPGRDDPDFAFYVGIGQAF